MRSDFLFYIQFSSAIFFFFFFFNDTATTEIYTLSLHDALPIWTPRNAVGPTCTPPAESPSRIWVAIPDRKSTRLNSSHLVISYAVFCLKKKKKQIYVYFFLKKKQKYKTT